MEFTTDVNLETEPIDDTSESVHLVQTPSTPNTAEWSSTQSSPTHYSPPPQLLLSKSRVPVVASQRLADRLRPFEVPRNGLESPWPPRFRPVQVSAKLQPTGLVAREMMHPGSDKFLKQEPSSDANTTQRSDIKTLTRAKIATPSTKSTKVLPKDTPSTKKGASSKKTTPPTAEVLEQERLRRIETMLLKTENRRDEREAKKDKDELALERAIFHERASRDRAELQLNKLALEQQKRVAQEEARLLQQKRERAKPIVVVTHPTTQKKAEVSRMVSKPEEKNSVAPTIVVIKEEGHDRQRSDFDKFTAGSKHSGLQGRRPEDATAPSDGSMQTHLEHHKPPETHEVAQKDHVSTFAMEPSPDTKRQDAVSLLHPTQTQEADQKHYNHHETSRDDTPLFLTHQSIAAEQGGRGVGNADEHQYIKIIKRVKQTSQKSPSILHHRLVSKTGVRVGKPKILPPRTPRLMESHSFDKEGRRQRLLKKLSNTSATIYILDRDGGLHPAQKRQSDSKKRGAEAEKKPLIHQKS